MFKYLILTGICACVTIVVIVLSKFPVKYILRDMLSKETPLETVKNVDLNRYQGTWYSVYEFYAWFQTGCLCTKAEYTVLESGKVEVKNSCQRDGNVVTATAIAWPITEGDNSRLYVMFRPPFKCKYYILALDDDYQYALVGTPDRSYLWVLSRSKFIDGDTLNKLKAKAEELGFDCSRLLKVNHGFSALD